jgi:hypothetical protein
MSNFFGPITVVWFLGMAWGNLTARMADGDKTVERHTILPPPVPAEDKHAMLDVHHPALHQREDTVYATSARVGAKLTSPTALVGQSCLAQSGA